MKKLKYFLPLIILSALYFGCERQDIGEYENNPMLYFFKGKQVSEGQQTDSVVYSFFFAEDSQMRDVVYINIRTMGLKTDYPRPVSIEQTNIGQPGAAVAGKHFVAFDSEEIKNLWQMPAGEVKMWVPIIVLRDPSLDAEKVELKLRIVENEFFKQGIDTLLNFRVMITSMAEKPLTWDSWWYYAFGNWGERKMWFAMNYLGIKDFNEVGTDRTYLSSHLKSVAQKQLAIYNKNNPTLEEKDGTPVTF